MDIEKLIERLQNAAGGPEGIKMCQDAAIALSTLQAENESLKEKLYDGEGVNLVDYWMQQAKIEENGHRNCQAENEKLRADVVRLNDLLASYQNVLVPELLPILKQVKRERDAAVALVHEWEEYGRYLSPMGFTVPHNWKED